MRRKSRKFAAFARIQALKPQYMAGQMISPVEVYVKAYKAVKETK